MARHVIETPFGVVWLHGEREPSERGGAVVLAITGAFAHETRQSVFHLQDFMGPVDVFAAHLPGNHCPHLAAANLGVWGAAYTHAAKAFGERPLIVLGESTGCLVALSVRRPNLVGLFLLEPFLTMRGLAPLIPTFKARAADPEWRPFLENVFGITPTRCEPRDYSHLAEAIRVPTMALYGLSGEGMPSIVGAEDRRAMAANPHVKSVVFTNAGHNLFLVAGNQILHMLRDFVSLCACEADSGPSMSRRSRIS